MSWSYRIVEYADGSGFGLHEVYCDKTGHETKMTVEPAGFVGDTPEEIYGQLLVAKVDARKRPVFQEPEDWKE